MRNATLMRKNTNMNAYGESRQGSRRWIFGAIAAIALALGSVVAPGAVGPISLVDRATAVEPAEQPAIPTPDGKTELTAAASCWEIKQRDPQSTNGIYWLATPAMGGAERFYCDQESAGGGWVLVGRGRDGWSVASIGSGTPAQVRNDVTGQAAFTPRQLSSESIEKLVNNEAIDSLPDGIRLVRARNAQGTQWHDLSFTFNSPRKSWTWQFNNEQRVKNYKIGNGTYSGGTTANFGRNNDYDRVRTITGSTEGWQMGFAFGSNIRGENTSSSYLWSKNTSTGYARPFTQVYLRPQLMSDQVYAAIPNEGTAAVTGPSVVDGFALTNPWGVAGLGAGPASIEGSNEVSAFTEAGGAVFVGGNFTRVQRSSNGSGAQEQAYLGAFDRSTGEWIASFRPTFNNQVKALAALPGNRIAAGGYFTQVNGAAHEGLVVLNAATGEVDQAFTGRLLNYLSGGIPVVRTLDVQGDWLYAAGTFTHSTGGTETRETYTRSAARFNVSNGTPDGSWNPELSGTVMSIDASALGDRVYAAGYFSSAKGQTAEKAAALDAATALPIPWSITFSNVTGGRSGYQQAVQEVGDRVWVGGSEHSLFSYARDGFALLSTTIGNNGGDFQAIANDGVNVYGACHCFETQYEGAKLWPNVGTQWHDAFAVYGSGAWSAATGTAVPSFNGTFNTRGGAGAWALFVDSQGTLWQGGDWTASTRQGFIKQWSGGFVRHAQRDASAPTTPTALVAEGNSEGVALNWVASTDDRGVVGYEVLRNDRVVATAQSTSVTLPRAPAATKYFVRAIDAQGNRSASTAGVVAAITADPPVSETIIAAGADWAYWYSAAEPGSGWNTAGFDDSAWSSGAAPLGWGQAQLGTTLPTLSPKPLASFYRSTFELAPDSPASSIEITTRADDGIVLYVNGTEATRVNVDAGYAGVGTYANTAVSASASLANPVTFTVPRSMLVAGTNIIGASVHSNYRSTPSHSFELTAVAAHGEVDPFPEPDPEPVTQLLIAAGSDWAYSYEVAGPETEWNTAEFDDAAWTTGAAPLGWGHAQLGTVLTAPAPKPLASFYRHEFDLAPGTMVDQVELVTRADDGIVVYVNGVEVQRKNVDPGAVGVGTYANTPVSAAAALANLVTFELPASAFIEGTNVIAASVHSNYRSTPSHSFELTAVATLSEDPALAVQRAAAPGEPAEANTEPPQPQLLVEAAPLAPNGPQAAAGEADGVAPDDPPAGEAAAQPAKEEAATSPEVVPDAVTETEPDMPPPGGGTREGKTDDLD